MASDQLLPRAMRPISAVSPHLRVLQWNVLSDQLAVNFPRVSESVLDWPYRERLILAELTRADADILCLEEVDHFQDLQTALLPLGYCGIYEQKEDWHRDGTAIFYRANRLELEEKEGGTFTVRRQKYLLAKLRHKALNCSFVVVATHLKSYAHHEGTRLLQIQQILGHLTRYKSLPVVLAGDMNTKPQKEVYNLIRSVGFQSAYWNALRPSAEPEFTCLAYRESDLLRLTLDYVWVKGWQPCAVMTLPSEADIGSTGLPCSQYPSDHLALVCDLALASQFRL